jgi:hypothetical protein
VEVAEAFPIRACPWALAPAPGSAGAAGAAGAAGGERQLEGAVAAREARWRRGMRGGGGGVGLGVPRRAAPAGRRPPRLRLHPRELRIDDLHLDLRGGLVDAAPAGRQAP